MIKQIKRSQWRWIIGLGVCAALAGAIVLLMSLQGEVRLGQPGPVQTSVPVQLRQLVKTLELAGTLKPSKVLELAAPFDATVQVRSFAWGEPLAQGAVLLRLSTDDIDRDIRDAESTVQKAQVVTESLRNWGASLDVQRAQRAVASAQRQVSDGERKLAETSRLLDLGVVPRVEFDDLKTQQQQLAEQLAASRDELTSARGRGGASQRRSAELELDNARNKWRSLVQDRAKRELVMTLAGTVSPSPSRSGGVAASLEVGSRVKRGDVLLRMQSADQFELVALADESDITRLQKGQKASIKLTALPDVRLSAVIGAISALPVASESDRPGEAARYEARLVLDALAPADMVRLRQGMSGQASVEVYRRDEAIQLPFDAVRQDAGGAYVMVLDGQGRQTRQTVRTGVAGVSEIEVFGPLLAGMTVLLGSTTSPTASTASSPAPSQP